MSKILTIGSVSQDIFFPTDEGVIIDTPEDILSQKKIAFELGAKYHIVQRYETLGGCSINVAAGLAKLGEEVACYTTVGGDAIGNWICQELKNINVAIDDVVLEKGYASDLSAIIVDKRSADRIIFSNQTANQRLVFNPQKINVPEWIFIGDLSGEWQENVDKIISFSKQKDIKIAFNPRQKTIHDDVQKIIETIAACDLFIVNKDEAIEIVSAAREEKNNDSINDEKYLITELKNLGAKAVALTDGIRGAWGLDGVELLYVPALTHEDTVDSTGAGDAFTSGFIAARVKGKNLATALQWGIANSSNSIREYGGQKGLLDEKGIVSMADNIKSESI